MILVLTGTILALSLFGRAQGQVPVSYLGCYRESPYYPFFYKVYLDYRGRINWSKWPDLSNVIQACAREAVKRKYSYFAIKGYGQCSWGPNGLSITRRGRDKYSCYCGIGGPWHASVYKIERSTVDGEWSRWGAWSQCTRTCGGGRQSRTRGCTNPPPGIGGRDCPGSRAQFRTCNRDECSIDGGWSTWGAWSQCTRTCGSGRQARTRSCTNPPPGFGGRDCLGSRAQSRICNRNECPIDAGWSPWGSWSQCSQTCGGGTQSRTRSCTNPPPGFGGRDCPGSRAQSRVCNRNGCSINGGWSDWSPWGSCSRTCGGGTQTRTRTCTNPPPSAGGANCQGNGVESLSCNTNGCPVCREGSISFDSCGQRCSCEGGRLVKCVRIRKEFTSMTRAERGRYISAILTASTDPRFKTDYDRLLTDHRILFPSGIHERIHFLTWHRYFILLYENLLRRVDCSITVAYWDWSQVSGNPFSTANPRDLWHSGNTGFGGNGGAPNNCVQTGPFRESVWSIVPLPPNAPTQSGPRCLRRRFNGNTPDSAAVQTVLRIASDNFTDFELMLRLNLHDVVHCLIDETMCSIDSASAPEFFLHHGFIDKIWDDWQKKSDAHRNAFFPSINEVMPGTQVLPRDVINLSSQPGGVRVEYQPSSRPARLLPPAQGRGPRRPFSTLSEKAIRLFHTKQSEVRKAMEMNKMMQP